MWEGSQDPPGGPGRVGRPTRRSEKGRETHLEGHEFHQELQIGSGDPPGGPERVGRTHLEVREGSGDHLKVREWSGGPL